MSGTRTEGGRAADGAARDHRRRLEFRILGPLEVADDGRPLSITGPKPRALLAVLLLNANRVVPHDRLIDLLWGEQPPERARHVLQTHLSQLRLALEPERTPGAPGRLLVSHPAGYQLRVEPDQLDLHRFEEVTRAAHQDLAQGSPAEAAEKLRQALALWRGPALAEFESPLATRERPRLEELRLAALEARIDADLELGRHAGLVAELRGLASEHPLRERLWAQLMLALYRSGRPAEAAAAYQQARDALRDELGTEPSPVLQKLLKDVLNQAPGLAPPRETPLPAGERPPGRGGRGRRLAALGLGAALLLAAGLGAWAVHRADSRQGAGTVPCTFLLAEQPIPAGAGGPVCGVQLGQQWLDVDCAGVAASHGHLADLSGIEHRGDVYLGPDACVLVPTPTTSAYLNTIDEMPEDAVVVADYMAGAGSDGSVGVRCTPADCLFAEAGPTTRALTVDRVDYRSSRDPLPRGNVAPGNRASRIVMLVQGGTVRVWLNGQYQGNRTTRVRSAGAAEFLARQRSPSGYHGVLLYRLAVYYAVPAPSPPGA